MWNILSCKCVYKVREHYRDRKKNRCSLRFSIKVLTGNGRRRLLWCHGQVTCDKTCQHHSATHAHDCILRRRLHAKKPTLQSRKSVHRRQTLYVSQGPATNQSELRSLTSASCNWRRRRVIYAQGVFSLQNIIVISGMWQLFFVTLSLNNLGFETTGVIIISTCGFFRYRSIKWTVVSRKTDFTATDVNGYETRK